MDGAFQHGRGGEVSEWDTPVCEPEQILAPNPSLGIAVSRGGRTCAQCEITCGSRCHFGFTLSPSCWKVIRAFSRGLRTRWVEAVEQLLAGPMQPCRVSAKLERWAARIAPFIEADIASGHYPTPLWVCPPVYVEQRRRRAAKHRREVH